MALTSVDKSKTQQARDSRRVGELLLWALREPLGAADMPPLTEAIAEPLLQAALQHGIAAQLHEALLQAGELDRLGRPVREGLTRLRLSTTAQHLLVSADLSVVARALDTAGIAWAVMKGPALAALGYADPTLRWFSDLDVLVGPRDFGAAIDALAANGTTLLDLNWELQLSLWRSEASLRLPAGTMLDLHWHPVNDGWAGVRPCST